MIVVAAAVAARELCWNRRNSGKNFKNAGWAHPECTVGTGCICRSDLTAAVCLGGGVAVLAAAAAAVVDCY